ncbi:MAG: winged helix-turn-helix transcriptional regulator [Acidimicrobiales bacterium]
MSIRALPTTPRSTMVGIPDLARTEGPFSVVFHEAAELVGRRWTGAILFALAHGIDRFSELENAIPGLSARLLTERLRELEDVDVVKRVRQESGTRWSYRLTTKGDALRPVLIALNHWAVAWSGC